jgi:glycosyltransferase involved in cell wall biosynthesis
LVGRWLGVPVHYDMADVYPVWLQASRVDHPSLFSGMVRSPTVAAWVERQVVHRVATVFVVAEESRARCVALGVPPARVVLVGNTPANVEELAAEHAVPQEMAAVGARPVVLFVGNVLSDRGLDVAIVAMHDVAREVPDAALVLIGDGRDRPRLMQLTRAHGLLDHVYFLGWKPHGQHAPYYACAQVGILPFLATKHISITLANKLFDYMGAGLPVIASDVPPMRRILGETTAGVLVPPGDSAALADAIITLLGDERRRCTLGRNGRQAVVTRYRWSVDAGRLVAAIEAAASARPPAR